MIGQRFGRLVVLERAERPPSAKSVGKYWLCACDCGGETVAYGSHLRHGSRTGCGCVKPAHRTHGQTHSGLYAIWSNAKHRCNNKKCPAYPQYGGRGIKMHPDWEASFEAFERDVGPRPSSNHSLDRIDNDGNYEPGNCRWATRSEQQNNRRNNQRLVVNGVSMTVAQASRATGVSQKTICGRLRAGRSDADAVSRSPLWGKERSHG